MKKGILAVTFLLVSSAQAAEVESLKCEQDMRPVDGNYEAVELTRNEAGRYDVTFHRITSGFGGSVEDTTVTIAKNLKCVFGDDEARISQCTKGSTEEGEPTNSGLSTKLQATSQIADSKGRIATHESFLLEVYSPQLAAGAKQPGFPYMERPGRFEHEFRKDQGGIMVNRCLVK